MHMYLDTVFKTFDMERKLAIDSVEQRTRVLDGEELPHVAGALRPANSLSVGRILSAIMRCLDHRRVSSSIQAWRSHALRPADDLMRE